MTFPDWVYRVPQRSANWATMNSPRPPSSMLAARRRCGEVLLPSETSQVRRRRSRISRTRIGPVAWRIALVTSSLRISSELNTASSSPQSVSLRIASARTWLTAAGLDGTPHSATSSLVSTRVRPTSNAMSSLGLSVSSSPSTASQVCSGVWSV
jgi:hypothetical protein